MKAVVWTNYGPPEVLKYEEVTKPLPRRNEVLIKIHATTVTAGDCEVRELKFNFLMNIFLRLAFGIFKPRKNILGQELAGEIISIGEEVKKFQPGDRVFGATMMKLGGYAEYTCLPESYPLSIIPETVSYEEAATIPTGGINALHFLNKGKVGKSDHVLINGAGGSIGTYAIQLAKQRGAKVTVVDHGDKLKVLHSIGADTVLDYTSTDFTKSKERYDVIIDIVGNKSVKSCLPILKPKGRLVLGNPTIPGIINGIFLTMATSKKVYFELADYKVQALDELKELVKNEAIKPVMDKGYQLKEAINAHKYVESGQKKGNLVLHIWK